MAYETEHGLIIIGSGPAGSSAAIKAGSEGLRPLVIEADEGLGGQASESSLIENYAGFPDGISGTELSARMIA